MLCCDFKLMAILFSAELNGFCESQPMELHLVADTNLFFECKPLDELPWAELDRDPIVIILTKPVLDEIDKHKNATGRTRERAIDINKRIRAMLDVSPAESVVRESGPRVVLRLVAAVVPEPELGKSMDYGKADEKLLGIVAALKACQQTEELALFTDDAGPASMAKAFGIPFRMIPSSWRRQAKETDQEKRIRSLEKDLDTYRSQEPKIAIKRCEPADENDTVMVVARISRPLTPAEIGESLEALRQKHPMKADFVPPDGFESPTVDQIKTYLDQHYPKWIEDCRAVLTELHVGLDEEAPRIVLRWPISNEGTRPATHVRVKFEAQGPLRIRRLSKDEDEERQVVAPSERRAEARPSPRFAPPPKPPAFKRIVVSAATTPLRVRTKGFDIADFAALGAHSGIASKLLGPAAEFNRLLEQHKAALGPLTASEQMRRHMESMGRMSALNNPLSAHYTRGLVDSPTFKVPPMPTPHQHDPEAFYFQWKRMLPIKTGALTCDLWRHQAGEKTFEFEVVFDDEGPARGSVLCTVHAENLTLPAQARVKVERKVEEFRPLELAKTLVESCV